LGNIIIVTGSGGLVGSSAVEKFISEGYTIIGIDNDMRKAYFGLEASTEWNILKLRETYKEKYLHLSIDIRDKYGLEQTFSKYKDQIKAIIHTAAQPSHDFPAIESKNILLDFDVNARATLILLELTRLYCKEASFIYCSTNKVYGDTPNFLEYIETPTRYDLDISHMWYNGIDEIMSIDDTKHSLFGVSKASGDLLVQEYGKYFGMNTVCFRGGCLTGPAHSGTRLHGFLSYLMKCTMTGEMYYIYGYKGKQVRDNIHSYDLCNAFYEYIKKPIPGKIYNIGGGRENSCSILEAIEMCELISGKKLNYTYGVSNRIGDHKWWITSLVRFKYDFPDWKIYYNLTNILENIYSFNKERWKD